MWFLTQSDISPVFAKIGSFKLGLRNGKPSDIRHGFYLTSKGVSSLMLPNLETEKIVDCLDRVYVVRSNPHAATALGLLTVIGHLRFESPHNFHSRSGLGVNEHWGVKISIAEHY